jgi:N-acetylneuraminic acid mutarotase
MMSTGRAGFGACAFAGEVYVIGGLDSIGNFISSVEKYSPSKDAWSAVAPLPEALGICAAISVGSAIFVLGGEIGGGADRHLTESVLKFDDVRGVWSRVAPMPEARAEFAGCVVGTDIYVFGGMDNLGVDQTSALKYDTEANTWSVLAPMPDADFGHNASVIDGLIYMIGAGGDSRSLLRLEPVTGAWSTLSSTLHRHLRGTSFVLGGYLYAAGGIGSPSVVERYNVATNTWTTVANMLEGRSYFSAVTIRSTGPAEEEDLFDSLIAKAIREGQ